MNKYVNIIMDDKPSLREKSKEVTLPLNQNEQKVLLDMLKYIRDSKNDELKEKYKLKPGIGLAAPQIGINKRLIVIDIPAQDTNDSSSYQYALANPKIISHSMEEAYLDGGEGCLSVEKQYVGNVYRFARITVTAYDLLQDKNITIRAKGYLAICLQHEIDHLNGILYYDRIDKNDPLKIKENAIKL